MLPWNGNWFLSHCMTSGHVQYKDLVVLVGGRCGMCAVRWYGRRWRRPTSLHARLSPCPTMPRVSRTRWQGEIRRTICARPLPTHVQKPLPVSSFCLLPTPNLLPQMSMC